MKIQLSPQRRDDQLVVGKQGDVLIINGEVFDFSLLPDGGTLPSEAVNCEFIVGEVGRVAGELELTLVLPHSAVPSQAVAFPASIINPPDGLLVFPA